MRMIPSHPRAWPPAAAFVRFARNDADPKGMLAMAGDVQVVRTVSELRERVRGFRAAKHAVALVPTMGALHEGHLSLVRAGRKMADRVVVSIFVNPAQFAPTEDFSTYPRTWDADLAALAQADADLVWIPSPASEMYPDGFATQVVVGGPARVGLEDAFRPHFFSGVATVVAKLLIQTLPDIALFGEKDYQQLRVVTQMAKDLDITCRIVGVPTVREPDGLAMSSRNVYLSAQERAVAPTLYRVLSKCADEIKAGKPIEAVLQHGREAIASAGFRLDYLEARHAATLEPVSSLQNGPVRLLVAAKLGNTRLIDNAPIPAD